MLATITTLVFICAPVAAPGLTMPHINEPPAAAQTEVVVDKGYPLQILAVDALGLAVAFGGVQTVGEPAVWAGVGILPVGPALVHASHKRGGAAVASLAMRPALTIGGLYAGAMLRQNDPDCHDFCNVTDAVLGGMAGYGLAVIIDAAVLARTKHSVREQNWMPTVNATSSSVQLGVGGRF